MDITHNLDGGVLKEVLIHGNGTDKPHKGCKAWVHYTGTLSDGTVFDKTNDEPFQFTIGKGRHNLVKIVLHLFKFSVFFSHFRYDY